MASWCRPLRWAAAWLAAPALLLACSEGPAPIGPGPDAASGEDGGSPPEAGPAAVEACPGLGCDPACPNGVLKDPNGCDTCTCAPAADGGVCTGNADCPGGGLCGYDEALGCSAVGSCFPAPGAICNAYEPGCACDGSEINVICNGLPAGYAPAPLFAQGACTDAGSGGLGSDGGAGSCCPQGYSLYTCTFADGGAGQACHNPALGCASSLTCGQGCDPVVTGRCP